jgi:energy-coupling factor transport system substrate-specific component
MSTHHRTARGTSPSGSSTPRTIPASGRLLAWRGIDLITAAMLAVALGVVFWGFDTFIYPVVSAATAGFPPLGEVSLGVWLIPAVVGGLVVRRPGAALFTELVAANVELFLGNKWGLAVLLSGLLQGLGVELVLAATRWRRFGAVTAVLGGVAAAVLEIVGYEWWAYTPDYSTAWKAVYLLCGAVSGAVIAGLGGWGLVRYLARAGALNAFPVGQEVRESAAAR